MERIWICSTIQDDQLHVTFFSVVDPTVSHCVLFLQISIKRAGKKSLSDKNCPSPASASQPQPTFLGSLPSNSLLVAKPILNIERLWHSCLNNRNDIFNFRSLCAKRDDVISLNCFIFFSLGSKRWLRILPHSQFLKSYHHHTRLHLDIPELELLFPF